VGSPEGDDAVGLAVAGALARGPALPEDVRVLALERPGLDLLDALRSADFALIVDALRDGGAIGSIRRLVPTALARAARAPSSHSLGVAEALALGEALGALPPRVEILGIEIGGEGEGGCGAEIPLAPAVAAAVGPACRAVRALLAERGPGPPQDHVG